MGRFTIIGRTDHQEGLTLWSITAESPEQACDRFHQYTHENVHIVAVTRETREPIPEGSKVNPYQVTKGIPLVQVERAVYRPTDRPYSGGSK